MEEVVKIDLHFTLALKTMDITFRLLVLETPNVTVSLNIYLFITKQDFINQKVIFSVSLYFLLSLHLFISKAKWEAV